MEVDVEDDAIKGRKMTMLTRRSDPKTGDYTWCEPAQSTCTSTCKMSQEQFYIKINRKKAAAQLEHPDQAPAFSPTARTPECGHTVYGTNACGIPRATERAKSFGAQAIECFWDVAAIL